MQAFCKAQHIDGAKHAGLGRLHRIFLIIDGAGRAGQVINLINLDIKREGDVMADDFKVRLAHKRQDIIL